MSTSATPMVSPPPVVCAGLVVADHVTPPLDHLPRPGELIAVDNLVLNIGGGAANTAVNLARLGVSTAICAASAPTSSGGLRPRLSRVEGSTAGR